MIKICAVRFQTTATGTNNLTETETAKTSCKLSRLLTATIASIKPECFKQEFELVLF